MRRRDVSGCWSSCDKRLVGGIYPGEGGEVNGKRKERLPVGADGGVILMCVYGRGRGYGTTS